MIGFKRVICSAAVSYTHLDVYKRQTDTEGFPYTYDLTLGTLGVFGVKDSLVCTDLAGDVKKLHTYLFGDDGYEPSQTVKDISYTIQKAFGVGQ